MERQDGGPWRLYTAHHIDQKLLPDMIRAAAASARAGIRTVTLGSQLGRVESTRSAHQLHNNIQTHDLERRNPLPLTGLWWTVKSTLHEVDSPSAS